MHIQAGFFFHPLLHLIISRNLSWSSFPDCEVNMALGCSERNQILISAGAEYTAAITTITQDAFYRISSRNNLLALKAYDGRTKNEIKIA